MIHAIYRTDEARSQDRRTGGWNRMNMDKIAVFRMTTDKMSWLAERQRVLSQNIANSDTPEYRPRDLQKVDFRQNVRSLNVMRLKKTHANHVSLVLCGPLHIPQRVGSRLRGCTSGLSSSVYVFRTSSSGWYAVRVINRRTPFTVV